MHLIPTFTTSLNLFSIKWNHPVSSFYTFSAATFLLCFFPLLPRSFCSLTQFQTALNLELANGKKFDISSHGNKTKYTARKIVFHLTTFNHRIFFLSFCFVTFSLARFLCRLARTRSVSCIFVCRWWRGSQSRRLGMGVTSLTDDFRYYWGEIWSTSHW